MHQLDTGYGAPGLDGYRRSSTMAGLARRKSSKRKKEAPAYGVRGGPTTERKQCGPGKRRRRNSKGCWNDSNPADGDGATNRGRSQGFGGGAATMSGSLVESWPVDGGTASSDCPPRRIVLGVSAVVALKRETEDDAASVPCPERVSLSRRCLAFASPFSFSPFAHRRAGVVVSFMLVDRGGSDGWGSPVSKP